MTKSIDDLKKERESLSKKVVKLQAVIVAYDVKTVEPILLDLDLTSLLEYRQCAESLHDQTFKATTSRLFETDHEGDFDTILGCIKTLQLKVMTMSRDIKEKNSAHISPSFKLSRISLPKFSGNFAEWKSFHDLFSASVDKNPSLSGAEKMVYLKSSLLGEAASIISSFQATEQHYKEAWESVINRYDNKKEIVFSHLKKFDDFKPLRDESSTGLHSLADNINELVRSLKVLGELVDAWDTILIYYSVKKLDPETRKQWSLDQAEETDLPELKEFVTFIESRARALADSNSSSSSQKRFISSGQSSSEKKNLSSSHHVSTESSSRSCLKCSKPHHLYQCNDFAAMGVQDRKSLVVDNKLCFNCMFSGHSSRNCPVNFKCRHCGLKHHRLLHQDSTTESSPAPVSSLLATSKFSDKVVLLSTLLVKIRDATGKFQTCRAFLDTGSETNFVSEDCAKRLGVKGEKTNIPITGIGGTSADPAKAILSLTIHSCVNMWYMNIQALVYHKLTANRLPRASCESSWDHLKNLQLADPNYHQPSGIDLILGATVAAACILPAVVRGPEGSPVGQLTSFGWILSGAVIAKPQLKSGIVSFHVSGGAEDLPRQHRIALNECEEPPIRVQAQRGSSVRVAVPSHHDDPVRRSSFYRKPHPRHNTQKIFPNST
jgi:hypothetical protein